jgi:hypothetical protein
MTRLEVLLLTVLGGFAAIFLFLSKDYNPTAGLFPRYIAIASLLFLALTIWGRKQETSTFDLRPSNFPQLPRILAVQGAYLVLIYLAGFFFATFVFLLIAPIQMCYRRRSIVAVHAAVLTLILAGSVLWLFNIHMPTGVLWDLW